MKFCKSSKKQVEILFTKIAVQATDILLIRAHTLKMKFSNHNNCTSLTFDTPEMISVLLFVGVFRATFAADSVSCRMAVSATGSRPLDRRLLSEQQKHKYVNQHYTIAIYANLYCIKLKRNIILVQEESDRSNFVYHVYQAFFGLCLDKKMVSCVNLL